jgi:hypothetical protein
MSMTFDPIQRWRERRRRQAAEADAEARVRHNEQRRERARAAYLTAGGDDAGFKTEWPTIRRELLREQTMKSMRGDK